jgi:hypothetical protein
MSGKFTPIAAVWINTCSGAGLGGVGELSELQDVGVVERVVLNGLTVNGR